MIELTTNPAAHTPDYMRQVAATFSECVRVLNHATHPGNGCPGLKYPSDVSSLLGYLQAATYGLPQLLKQTAGFLQDQSQAGLLADTTHDDASQWARVVAADLEEIAGRCENLGYLFSRRQQDLSGMYVENSDE